MSHKKKNISLSEDGALAAALAGDSRPRRDRQEDRGEDAALAAALARIIKAEQARGAAELEWSEAVFALHTALFEGRDRKDWHPYLPLLYQGWVIDRCQETNGFSVQEFRAVSPDNRQD